jgi:hypothetical protein
VHEVTFLVRIRTDLGGVSEVVPAIDETALTDLVHAFELRAGLETRSVSYGGLIPAHFDFGPLDLHYLDTSDGPQHDWRPLLGCSCGEWGCWPLLARITAAGDSVTWTDFQQPHRKQRDYSAFGPFSFSRKQYDDALAQLVARVNQP